jgi:hypothetical protein
MAGQIAKAAFGILELEEQHFAIPSGEVDQIATYFPKINLGQERVKAFAIPL